MGGMSMMPSLTANEAAMEYLLSRRSRPPKHLGPDAPDAGTLEQILTAASRVPDHGKLEPWRFLVLERAACERMALALVERGTALGIDADKLAKGADAYRNRGMVIAVVQSPKASEKIPEWEQSASAACVCLGVVNAALASGWGAVWLTGWASTDEVFLSQTLGLKTPETVMGFIHIGNETAPPMDRPRPDVSSKITRITS